MKKNILYLPVLALVVVVLSGCGNQGGGASIKSAVKTVDVAQTANSVAQDSLDKDKVSSDENINNIVKMMNYQGLNPDDNQKMKEAVKKGVEDGKSQADLDKDLINNSAKVSNSFGTGYVLGYTFGCKAATGNETQCQKDIGQKYQEIILEAIQGMASSSGDQQQKLVPSSAVLPGDLKLNP